MRKKLTLQTVPKYYGTIVEKLKMSRPNSTGCDSETQDDVAAESGVNFLVSSAERRDGRTTTAVGLAIATAVTKPSQKVLLVDLDHRNPALHAMLAMRGAGTSAGILDVIRHDVDLEDAAQLTNLDNLQVLFRGQGKLEVPEDCTSVAMLRTLRNIRSRYDYAFYDSPALNAHVDAKLLSQVMDSVLLVIRYDRSQKTDVLAAKKQIPKGKLAGAIVNDFRDPIPSFIARSL